MFYDFSRWWSRILNSEQSSSKSVISLCTEPAFLGKNPQSELVNEARHIASTCCLAHGHSKPGHIECGSAWLCPSANSVWAAEPFAAVTEILQKLEAAAKEICWLIEFQSPRIYQLQAQLDPGIQIMLRRLSFSLLYPTCLCVDRLSYQNVKVTPSNSRVTYYPVSNPSRRRTCLSQQI